MMRLLTVGVGDCKVSNAADSVLATYALGSCIAVAIHDPVATVGGLLHFMLPESSLNLDKASQSPFMFADTGIALLFHAAYGLGAEKRRLVVRAAGDIEMPRMDGLTFLKKLMDYQHAGRRDQLARPGRLPGDARSLASRRSRGAGEARRPVLGSIFLLLAVIVACLSFPSKGLP